MAFLNELGTMGLIQWYVRVGILHVLDGIISVRDAAWAHKTRYWHTCSKEESETFYMCVSGIDYASFSSIPYLILEQFWRGGCFCFKFNASIWRYRKWNQTRGHICSLRITYEPPIPGCFKNRCHTESCYPMRSVYSTVLQKTWGDYLETTGMR